MDQQTAEVISLRGLGWIASQDDVFEGFLAATGSSAAEVRARAGERDFLVAVLDFLLQRDDWVIAFAQSSGLGAEQPMMARAVLGGNDRMHWT
jgi:hypothetical protein